MKFSKEYHRVKRNYLGLNRVGRFTVWMRFAITPLKELVELIPSKGKLLDLGCGFGIFSYFLAWYFPELEIIGVDPSEHRIELANNVREKPDNLKFFLGENIDEKDFKTVLLIDVIYLLPKERLIAVLKECYQKTNSDGVLLIKTMNPDRIFRNFFSNATPWLVGKIITLFAKSSKNFGDRKTKPAYYSGRELKDILNQAGWTEVQAHDLPGCPYPHIIYSCRKTIGFLNQQTSPRTAIKT